MKSIKMLLLLFSVCLLSLEIKAEQAVVAQVSDDVFQKVEVLKNNVNLRARPDTSSEMVGQVSRGDKLRVKKITDEWVEIVPPDVIDLWVLSDYIREGVVDGDNLNVRAGAGINFNIVGQLVRGDSVVLRGAVGPWLSIAPSESSSLWVHSSLVELVPLPKDEPVEEPVTEVVSAEITDDESVDEAWLADVSEPIGPEAVAIAKQAGLDLVPAQTQGQRKQYEGVLRARSFFIRSPSKHRLVAFDENNRAVILCFVKGNEAQLDALLNRHVVIQGRLYHVRRSDYPVLVPERIVLKKQNH